MNAGVQRPVTPAEVLTEQFYRWEMRGRGWLVWERPVELEPPFRPFRGHFVPQGLFQDDAVEESRFNRLGESFLRFLGKPEAPPALPEAEEEAENAPEAAQAERRLVELQLALPKDFDPAEPVFEQLLFSLSYCRSTLAFEVFGSSAGITAQLVAEETDARQAFAQLKAHFPEAVVTPAGDSLRENWTRCGEGRGEIREFGLSREFMLPLQASRKLATDWLVALCGGLEYLAKEELGVLQVLFEPVRHPWAQSVWRAVTTSDGQPFFEDAPEVTIQTKQKLARPLYAVVVRIAARSGSKRRDWEIIKALAGALTLFRNPEGNELVPLENDEYPDAAHEDDLLHRCSRRSGMVLNSDELVSLAHLPTAAVRSRKLNRKVKHTKEPPGIAMGEGLVLGESEHDGKQTPVTLKLEARLRHLHVIGNSGTGKSTFLLNLICQDIYHQRGVAVLDPHGDLIDAIIGYIPPERYEDVILFDASDDEYPIGFNILAAHSDLERTLLANDLVEVFKRLSTTWGDQMRSVLGNAVLAFLESRRGGTLPELRRFLIEPAFRTEFLSSVQDPEVVYYWEHEFALLKTQSLGPLLTRLDEFLRRKTIRYMVGQRENKLDFARIMDEGQILLARLPQGLIGEDNSRMLGSLLVAKFHQLAIARQQREASERRPFFLYLDEFHHFVTPTLETILSGARKYGLGLTLAHQSVHQLQKAGEVGNAVLSMAGSRVCFRVGDDDARRLGEGFSYFTTSDLQNLENYEAICRIDRKENDFNFRTIRPPKLDEGASRRVEYLRYCTRLKFGTPRQHVEEELAKSRYQPKRDRLDPFAKRTGKGPDERGPEPKSVASAPPDAAPPVPEKPMPVDVPPPPKPKSSTEPQATVRVVAGAATAVAAPGVTQLEHEATKEEIRRLAEGLGFEVAVEELILDGQRRVDVSIRRGGLRIACEVCHTTTDGHELDKVADYLRAGFHHVALVASNAKRLARMLAAKSERPSEETRQVGCYSVAEFRDFLQERALATEEDSSRPRKRGIRLSSKLSEAERRRTEQSLLGKIAERMRKKRAD